MTGTIFFNTKVLLIVLLLGSALLVLCGYVTWTGMFVNLSSSRADPKLSQAGGGGVVMLEAIIQIFKLMGTYPLNPLPLGSAF